MFGTAQGRDGSLCTDARGWRHLPLQPVRREMEVCVGEGIPVGPPLSRVFWGC